MVKLDVTLIRYMSAEELRILTSVEMGMKNHELVPKTLINSISGLRNGGISNILLKLTQNKLLSYERGKRYDGYRVTYKGYDYLALNVLSNRKVLMSIGNQIGVGKESDVYVGGDSDGNSLAVKLHRLGRTCFRTVSTKRDYQKNGQKSNWIYMSRLAAKRELAFMKLLYDNHISIPKPIDCNRHCLVMELIDGVLLNHLTKDDIQEMADIESLYEKLMNLIIRLANEFGVIHGDFNEFNILIKSNSLEPVLIDFPQMISISHTSAQTYFDRDVKCIVDYFAKRFGFESDFIPCFEVIDKESSDKIVAINEIEFQDQSDDDIDGEDNQSDTEVKVESHETINKDTILVPQNNEKHLIDTIESLDIKENSNSDKDNNSENGSFRAVSSVASTFTSVQIKEKLQKERKRNEFRSKIKNSRKNIKGDNCAIARRHKDDLATLKDDIKTYHSDKHLFQ